MRDCAGELNHAPVVFSVSLPRPSGCTATWSPIDGALASLMPTAYLINAGPAGSRHFRRAESDPDWIGRGVGRGGGCYCN